jgi:hypothetical protein
MEEITQSTSQMSPRAKPVEQFNAEEDQLSEIREKFKEILEAFPQRPGIPESMIFWSSGFIKSFFPDALFPSDVHLIYAETCLQIDFLDFWRVHDKSAASDYVTIARQQPHCGFYHGLFGLRSSTITTESCLEHFLRSLLFFHAMLLFTPSGFVSEATLTKFAWNGILDTFPFEPEAVAVFKEEVIFGEVEQEFQKFFIHYLLATHQEVVIYYAILLFHRHDSGATSLLNAVQDIFMSADYAREFVQFVELNAGFEKESEQNTVVVPADLMA